MASKTKPARASRSRATPPAGRRRPPPEFCRYVVAIEDWDWSFSFALGDPRRDPEPYSDFRHLELRCTLLRPSRPKVRAVELTLLPNARPRWEDWPDNSPNGVGSLSLNRNLDRLLQGLLTVPADALTPILTMLIAGRFKYVLLDGEALHHGRASIQHYRLERTWADDD